MRYVFWWCIPCKAMAPVCRELAEIPECSVCFISAEDLSENRRNLGWQYPDFGKAVFELLPKVNWKNRVQEICHQNMEALHIFCGTYLYLRIRYALDYAQQLRLKTAVISEAPFNPYNGLLRSAKTIFTTLITPFRVWRRARRALFVLSASGNCPIAFRRLGWRKESIFPFGYFTDPPSEPKVPRNPMHEGDLEILCTGYLTRNKGHAVLLNALASVLELGVRFNCTITGFGPERHSLEKRAHDLQLASSVQFLGTVPDGDLFALKARADLFVAPGYEEPWGIRVNEALQSGIPVIVSHKIGASQLIEASRAGIVFPSGDCCSLAKAIYHLVSQPSRLAEVKAKALEYRTRIHPREAALYLHKVAQYATGTTQIEPGDPVWFSVC